LRPLSGYRCSPHCSRSARARVWSDERAIPRGPALTAASARGRLRNSFARGVESSVSMPATTDRRLRDLLSEEGAGACCLRAGRHFRSRRRSRSALPANRPRHPSGRASGARIAGRTRFLVRGQRRWNRSRCFPPAAAAELDTPVVFASSWRRSRPSTGGWRRGRSERSSWTRITAFSRSPNEGTAPGFAMESGLNSIGLRRTWSTAAGRDRGLTADPTFAMEARAQGLRLHDRLQRSLRDAVRARRCSSVHRRSARRVHLRHRRSTSPRTSRAIDEGLTETRSCHPLSRGAGIEVRPGRRCRFPTSSTPAASADIVRRRCV